jgi:branched-subunit amino acid transport protein
MTEIWIALIIVGLLTLATRLSFIFLIEKWKPPEIFRRSLRFVPLAVLSALIFPDVLMRDSQLALPPDWPRLIAGLTATLIAWRSKNMFLTIAAGMIIFYLLRFLLPA